MERDREIRNNSDGQRCIDSEDVHIDIDLTTVYLEDVTIEL